MATENVFERILDNAPDAVVWADAEGIVRYWNLGAEETLGWKREEAVGQSMDFFIPENLRERHWEGYRRVLGGGESNYGRHDLLKVPALRSDGSRVSIEFTLQRQEHPQLGLLAIAFIRDATETFNELRDLRRRLAAAEAPEASTK
ncbi:MAG: PAS domain S-box protein [Chloroflexi bacterium]|nr:PAS domain S-box protein [Chloroflexota bacterium]MQC16605.1 PAS domain S-box protein [Chloroflexota bacterium]